MKNCIWHTFVHWAGIALFWIKGYLARMGVPVDFLNFLGMNHITLFIFFVLGAGGVKGFSASLNGSWTKSTC